MNLHNDRCQIKVYSISVLQLENVDLLNGIQSNLTERTKLGRMEYFGDNLTYLTIWKFDPSPSNLPFSQVQL